MKYENIKDRPEYQALVRELQKKGFVRNLIAILDACFVHHQQPLTLFFRDDDIDDLTPNLIKLLQLFIQVNIPLHLQVIPAKVKLNTVHYLRHLKQKSPALVFISQHGWKHENYNSTGKKYEFGDSRTQFQQLSDIISGKDKMTQLFLNDFYLAFTPPWNRYHESTLLSLQELGFKIISADGGKVDFLNDHETVEISTAIDLYHCRPDPRIKSPAHLLFEIKENLKRTPFLGLLLHHHEMQEPDFLFLKKLLMVLKSRNYIAFPNFKQIYEQVVENVNNLNNLKINI